MSKASVSVSKAVLLFVAMLLLSFESIAIDLDLGKTVYLCDNFGKTWRAKIAPCNPALPLTVCMSGARDTTNILGCAPGGLPMWGDSVAGRFLFNAYVIEIPPSCNSTFWMAEDTGTYFSKIKGNVYNPGGLFGPFTLSLGACPVEQSPALPGGGASKDPSIAK